MARLSIVGLAVFLVIAVAVQAVHFHGMAVTPISAYLRGPYSGWLQAAYYVLACALAVLGVCLWRQPGPARQLFAGILLIIAGCAVVLVAYTYSPWPMPDDPSRAMRGQIHVKCAFVAFLSVTIVMFLEIPLRWRREGRAKLWAFAVLVLAVELASLPGPGYLPHTYGALEKLAIVGLVVWLILCARTMLREMIGRERIAAAGPAHKRP